MARDGTGYTGCDTPGCQGDHYAQQLCARCYRRKRRQVKRERELDARCGFAGCRAMKAPKLGFCLEHQILYDVRAGQARLVYARPLAADDPRAEFLRGDAA